MDEQLLDTARDCFYFVTRFFEPINTSATHIYHSALELSPASSTVRKSHYHRRLTPFPRVVVGISHSWDPSIAISNTGCLFEPSLAWSQCGQFVVTQTKEVAEIRDPLTFELLSTLKSTKSTSQLVGALAYSPDGRSLACTSNAAIIIWDIQTGGVAKELQYTEPPGESLVWSLDGGTISTTNFGSETNTLAVHRYNAASGAALSPITLRSEDKPHLWAHDKSFRVMTTAQDGEACTVDIFEIGPTPIRVESLPIQLGEGDYRIKSFSSTTYRVSVSTHHGGVLIFDLRNSECLLKGTESGAQCFSPDGSIFAASWLEQLRTWKYENGRYTPWRQFPTLAGSISNLLFSPTSSSILVNLGETLRLWRFDGPYVDSATDTEQITALSPTGAYLATACSGECTVTITSLLSQTPSQFIDTDMAVFGLGFTKNVVLVVGSQMVVAWLLTEGGMVNGVSGNRRAGRGDSVWTIPTSLSRSRGLMFSVEGETGVVKSDGKILHAYNTGTGEVLEPARVPPQSNGPWYSLTDIMQTWHHLFDGSVGDAPSGDDWRPSEDTVKEGWMIDREGRHLLWLPVEWRAVDWNEAEWFSNIAAIRFEPPGGHRVIVKLY